MRMRDIVLGSLGFVLFWISDFNSIWWKKRWLQGCFTVGCLLLAASTVDMVIRGWPERAGAATALCLTAAAVFLCILIYTLFFAIPFQESYGRQDGGRRVCKRGVYALCRHPGVLWLAGFYLFLWLALGGVIPLAAFAVFSLLDVVYVVIQDRIIFPALFDDYGEYREQVPFLWPDKTSVLECKRTWRRGHKDEI